MPSKDNYYDGITWEGLVVLRSMVSLLDASSSGDLGRVKEFVDADAHLGIDDTDGHGLTALAMAVRGGHHAIVNTLLQAGADPDVKDMDERTALWIAVDREDKIMARMLLANGADPGIKDGNGYTAMIYAAIHKKISIYSTLAQHHCDPDEQCSDGSSARSHDSSALAVQAYAVSRLAHSVQLFTSIDIYNIYCIYYVS